MNSEPLYEMSRVGITNNGFIVSVYDNEGSVPHVHVSFGKPRNPEFESCVRLDKAEYFNHKSTQKKLSSKQKAELIKFFNKKGSGKMTDISNWEFAVELWNRNNSFQLKSSVMPNYEDLG